MITYRGIELADGVKLCKKDGSYYIRTKNALDKLADFLSGKDHNLLSEYKDDKTMILIDFGCGHDPSWKTPDSYKRGDGGCLECRSFTISETKIKQPRKEFALLVDSNGHKLLSEYNGNHEKLLIDFQCYHEPQLVTPAHYKKSFRCPKCGRKEANKDRSKEAERELASLVEENGHKLMSEYISTHTNVLINFDCEHEPQWISPANYKNRGRCPECRESKGARRVRIFLQENSILFEKEYEFEDLMGLGGKPLRFDFAIFNEDDSLRVLVEYDGEFHDQPILGEENLRYQQTHDRMKYLYCRNKNIDLLRIHYEDFDNIECILDENITRKGDGLG